MKKTAVILLFLIFSKNIALGQQELDLPAKVEVTIKESDLNVKEKSISEIIKDWLIPVSTFITLITISVGAYQSLREYRLKLQAETRLSNSTQVEMDIKLINGFTELLALAHARKGSYLSEKTVEMMFEKELFTQEELKDPNKLNKKLEQVAVLNIFSGEAEQTAFVAAITNLGLKHEILRVPTIQALETMKNFIPEVASKYLIKFKNES